MDTPFFIVTISFEDGFDDDLYHFYGVTPLKAVEAAINGYREICSDKYNELGLEKPYVFDENIVKTLNSINNICGDVTVERKYRSHDLTVLIEAWQAYIHS